MCTPFDTNHSHQYATITALGYLRTRKSPAVYGITSSLTIYSLVSLTIKSNIANSMLKVTHSCHLWAYYPLVRGSTGSTPDTMRMDTPHPQGAYTTTIPRKFHALLLVSQAPFKCNPTTAAYFLYCCIVPI